MAELQQLQDFEIPTGREALRGNHSALLRVADYCEDNYVQATDKRKALEETMAFATQALASVAYQVGNLAGHTLRMLDLQGAALRQVEARVSTLGQMVNMHLEKVARREIGTLATVQRLYPGQKVVAPESLPPLEPYCRRPINFGCLDDIGHGVKCLPVWSRLASNSRRSSRLSFPRTDITGIGASRSTIPHVLVPAGSPSLPSLPQPSPRSSQQTRGRPPASPSPGLRARRAPLASYPTPVPTELPPPPELDDLGLPPPPPEPTQVGLELVAILLPQPPECWDYRCAPPCPAEQSFQPSWEESRWPVVTLYPYTRQKDNELSFAEGAVICVTRRYSDGWCEGVSAEGTGFFPGNYVVPSC
uniref:ABI gene family member 3 n=1 Tax=Chinchilla lanigera TaxID=34839 RepID=A0A8C2W1C8_CHILA